MPELVEHKVALPEVVITGKGATCRVKNVRLVQVLTAPRIVYVSVAAGLAVTLVPLEELKVAADDQV